MATSRNSAVSGSIAGFGIIGVIGIITRVAAWGLDMFGRVQTAKSLYDVMGPFTMKGIALNWGAIYLWMTILSGALLIVMNWDFVSSRWSQYCRAKTYEWNASLSRAVDHVTKSRFGEALDEKNNERKLYIALQAGTEAAKSGKIKLGGTVPGTSTPKKIRRRELKHLKLERTPVNFGNLARGQAHFENMHFVRTDGDKGVAYDRVFTDYTALNRVWP